MYDATSPSDRSALQRACGGLAVSLKRRDGATVLDGLSQSGCLKARMPRPANPGWADIVTMNISGGVAGGDRLESAFAIGPDARATIAAQAAERFYRAPADSGPAIVRTEIVVASDAAAEWLPQDTILFDGCAIDRRLEIDLAASAWFLGLEMLVFGRAAMGEVLARGLVRDRIRLRRAGRLLWQDTVRLEGDIASLLQRTPIAAGARTAATLVYAAADAASALEPLRAALEPLPVESGVSAWQGMLVARMLAADSASLRRAVVAALQPLRGERALPRVWLC
jgi:urease accessory protein